MLNTGLFVSHFSTCCTLGPSIVGQRPPLLRLPTFFLSFLFLSNLFLLTTSIYYTPIRFLDPSLFVISVDCWNLFTISTASVLLYVTSPHTESFWGNGFVIVSGTSSSSSSWMVVFFLLGILKLLGLFLDI